MKISESTVEDIESLIKEFQNNNEVAYAEVGAIFRDKSVISTAGEDIQRCSNISNSGIWCRVFANGAAGYRFMQDPENVSRVGSLALKRAQVLGQSAVAQYDTITAHEGSHTGWATNQRNVDVDIDKKADTVRRGLNMLDRAKDTRIHYMDVSRDDIIFTTTGGAIRTSIDRNWVDIHGSVDTKDGMQIKINKRAGSTLGFEDSANDLIDKTVTKLSEQRSRLSNHVSVNRSGSLTATLSSSVAGRLFHQLSRYLEMDTIYFGSSPAEIGDKLTSSLVDINDTIEPGNWAAIGFDGEAKVASPTKLISNGIVKNRIHSTITALEENKQPKGHFIPSMNLESPPRIHVRHLDIEPGSALLEDMLEESDVYIRAVGTPTLSNEATKTKQSSYMPPCALYAKDIADKTPEEYINEASNQALRFPITEAYVLENSEQKEIISDASLVVTLDDFQTISNLGLRRSTIDGIHKKSGSEIPFSVTSPSITLNAEIR